MSSAECDTEEEFRSARLSPSRKICEPTRHLAPSGALWLAPALCAARLAARRTGMAHSTDGPGIPCIPTLETERLRLRPFRKSDLDDYSALYADREVLRYLGAGSEPWDRGRSSRHLAFLLGHWQLWGAGTWAMEHKESGAFLGAVGFSAPEGWPGFELAWTLARRAWGCGYATEGARAAMGYAFTVWKRDRIVSLIAPENHASIRVAERLGERLEDHIHHLGRELLCYGLDREAYSREVAPVDAMALCATP
jgi:RimJ/RimL family protein N-acetyltransferase